MNSAIIAGVALYRPEYLSDYRLNKNPDAVQYVLQGRNTILHGQFSRSVGPPYVPDMLRTPVYPVFAGALDVFGKALAIYLAQALLQVASCAVLYKLAVRHFGKRTACLASLFLATDLMWAVSNCEAMSETLFVFLMLCSTERLSSALCSQSCDNTYWLTLGVAGLLLGLATLTRPVAIYLVALDLAIVLFTGPLCRSSATRWFGAAIFMIATLIPPGGWIVRNYSVFLIPRLTYVDLGNLVYFVGAGAYQVENGLDLESAQQVISEEFGLLPYRAVQNIQKIDYPLTKLVSELRRVWPQVVFRYPRSLVLSSAGAILKATGSHNVAQLAELTGRSWIPPKSGGLVRFRSEAFERLGKNGFLLTTAFCWQLAHTLLMVSSALLGVILMAKTSNHRPTFILCAATLCYFGLTIPLFGFDAYCRCRFPALPFLYLFAGFGVSRLAASLKKGETGPRVLTR